MKQYVSIHQAYLCTLHDVFYNPDYIAEPRGQRTREKLDYAFKILKPVAEPIKTFDEERNKVIAEYTAKEMALYDSGSNKVEDFEKASKFWTKLANPDGTINSAYGHLIWAKVSHGNPKLELYKELNDADGQYTVDTKLAMRTPWEWALASLIADKDSRQAILRFSLPEHQWLNNKDQVCTLHGIFMIRDNKLNLTINMRSNDMVLGLIYDLPWFISLMERMQMELSRTYPDLQIGTYTHIVHSLHCYDRNEEMILKMLGDSKTA